MIQMRLYIVRDCDYKLVAVFADEDNTEEYNLKEIHEILIDAHKNFLKYQENMSFSDHLIIDRLFKSIYHEFGILEKKWDY